MDKWQKRARAKKRARERQLRRRLMIAGCVFLVLIIVVVSVVSAGRKNKKKTFREPAAVVTIAPEERTSPAETAVPEPTEEPTPEPTEEPTPEPTEEPTPEPTEEPTPEPTEAPTPEPTAEPTETPENENTPAGHVPDERDAYALDPSNTVWNYDPQPEKTVYLTFDDGPSYITPQILDVLDQYGVKATFFVTSQSPPDAHYIAEAYQRGHTIGLHSSSHSFEIYESEEHFFDDLTRIGNVVRDQIGYVPCFMRFIGGSSNEKSKMYAEGIMTKLAAAVQEKGYQYWDWNGATGDGTEVTAEEELAEVFSSTADTIVVLAHDGPLKESTVEALPAIIQGFWDRGYTFKPLSRDATVVHHEIVN